MNPTIKGIRERESKATEGPWFAEGAGEAGLTIVDDGRQDGLFPFQAETNEAIFIAHARTDIPHLLQALDAARPFVNEIAERWDEELEGELQFILRSQARAWMKEYYPD